MIAAKSKSTQPIADWLNPRRRMIAEAVVGYLAWHGSKVFFNADVYADLQDEQRLDAYQVDGAIDDLYRLGCITISMAGKLQVVNLIDGDIDRLSRLGAQ